MARVDTYRDLLIWQRAILLSKSIYEISSSFPKEEIYGMTSQMRRSSISIPSNIAEGFGRSPKEFLKFLRIARGSLFELDSQLEIVKSINLIKQSTEIDVIIQEVSELGKMINSFMGKLKVD